ncbi:MAG: dockerin type I domain-containing protein, partial [Dehalococcoidia bacterium]
LVPNSGSHAVVSGPSGPSDVTSGAVTFTVTDSTIENVTFTATDVTDGVQLRVQPAIAFGLVSPPGTAGTIGPPTATVAADVKTAATLTVTLQNAQGQGASGKTITLSQGTGHSTISGPTPSTTDSNGQVRFQVTDSATEQVTYTAVDVTDGNLPVPGTAVVNFTNGKPANCFGTPIAAPGYTVTTFASGFPFRAIYSGFDPCVSFGPIAFDAAGNLLASGMNVKPSGPPFALYKLGPQGGVAGTSNILNTYDAFSWGLTFGKDGRLYAAMFQSDSCSGGRLVELDPSTGVVKRTLIDNNNMQGIDVDPVSGDLFGSFYCRGTVQRFANTAGANPAVSTYSGYGPFRGMRFGPDGTLYGVDYCPYGHHVTAITGTNTANPGTVSTLAVFPDCPSGPNELAVEQDPANPSRARAIYVNRSDGVITKIDMTVNPPAQTDILTGGSDGQGIAIGPDGCLYATQTDRILKIGTTAGGCDLNKVTPGLQLSLSPANLPAALAQGTPATFRTKLFGVTNPGGTSITFTVNGANPQTKVVPAAADGTAAFDYTGVFTGNDTVTASATVGSTNLSTPFTVVIWTAGMHTTFLNLNQSARSGSVNTAVSLTANLSDISLNPPAPVSGATVLIDAGNQECSGTTDARGNVSCSLTLTQPTGSYLLYAEYDGDAGHTDSNASDSFSISGSAIPSLTGLTPSQGSVRGGNAITIRSSNVQSGATVTVGGYAATNVQVGADGGITATTPAHPMVGDVNGDNTVTAVDALCLLRSVAGLTETTACPASALTTMAPVTVSNPGGGSAVTPTGFTYQNGDLNGDGKVDAVDALCILRSVAGLPATQACPSLTIPAAAGQVAGGTQPGAAPASTPPYRAAASPAPFLPAGSSRR